MSTPVGTYFIPADRWPWEPRVAVPVSTGHRSDSAVLLPDGRVLYVFVEGSDVKQGYAPDLETFLTVDGSVQAITTLFSGHQPNCCVFHSPAGGLFLAVSLSPIASTPEAMRGTMLWRSAAGDGAAWTHHGDVEHNPTPPRQAIAMLTTDRKAVGVPLFLSSGRWVLTAPAYSVTSQYWRHRNAVFVSDDQGVSWSRVVEVPHGALGGAYGSGLSRNIGQFDGRLYIQSSSSYASSPSRVWVSDDAGQTWASADSLGQTTWPSTDGDHLYRIRGGGLVERSATPGDGGGTWALVRGPFSGIGAGNGTIVQPLGSEFAYMHQGRVMAIRNVRRPVVGFIGWR